MNTIEVLLYSEIEVQRDKISENNELLEKLILGKKIQRKKYKENDGRELNDGYQRGNH